LLDGQRLGRKEPNMMTGVDYHPSFQQIVFLREETGEYSERRLNHSDGEADQVVSRPAAARSACASGDGGGQIFPLVRATAGRVVLRCGSAIQRRSEPSATLIRIWAI
jgi:hypothetical protein